MLYEEAGIVDTGLYQSVLAAVAAGEHTSSRIGGRLGRPASALAHPLAVLCDIGYLIRDDDLLHGRRSAYRIAEPLLRFHHAIVRPHWGTLQRPGRAVPVWASSDGAFRSAVLGPAWEEACRWFVEEESADWFPGEVVTVGRGTVADPETRASSELDIVVIDERRRVLLVGEAKWSANLGSSDRGRLERLVGLLGQRGYDVTRCRYLLASACGGVESGTADQTIDLRNLYNGR